MRISDHGGSCCGVKHLYGFSCGPTGKVYTGAGRSGFQQAKTIWNKFVKQFKMRGSAYGTSAGRRGKLIEIIITDDQIATNSADWLPLLKKEGFRLVSRFHNSSGGRCNVFHLTTQKCGDETVPKWWSDLDNATAKGEAPSDVGAS